MTDGKTTTITRKGPVRNARSRCWVFTSFETTAPEFRNEFRYLVYQQETCPTSGKAHFQGYVECYNAISILGLKDLLGNSVHFETRKGSQQQAIDYCKKSRTAIEGTLKEYGKPGQQGHRSDLDSIWEYAEQGKTTMEMLFEFRGNGMRHIGCYQKALEALYNPNHVDRQLLYNRVMEQEACDFAVYWDPKREEKIVLRHYEEFKNLKNITVATEVTGNTVPSLGEGGSPPALTPTHV